ncbi:copper chaperone PCu(A)C [Actinopolyspora halophila]|uniref:copper chaperone PCu(A)C n=1 Tax=Actinopolyspora halophila TaxID=1850 RepID=UPI00037E3115|nr:copper chaperone PCu(A)C [Actinopolyspora halophila]
MSRSQHSKAGRPRLVPAVVGLGAVVALSGCATGQQAETSQQTAAVAGANASTKTMAVRNATLGFPEGNDGEAVYEKGSSAPVDAVLVNESEQSDQLVRVSSSYAQSAEITGTKTIPGNQRVYAVQEQGGSTDELTAAEATNDERETVRISLNGLSRSIYPGTTIPVRFTFAEAGSVTLHVPIGPSPEPRPEHGSQHGSAESAEHSGSQSEQENPSGGSSGSERNDESGGSTGENGSGEN